jgi:hypothetical protein
LLTLPSPSANSSSLINDTIIGQQTPNACSDMFVSCMKNECVAYIMILDSLPSAGKIRRVISPIALYSTLSFITPASSGVVP